MTPEDKAAILAILAKHPANVGAVVGVIGEHCQATEPELQHFGDGVEYDDELEAQEPYVVSESADNGAWVLAWVYVEGAAPLEDEE